MPQVTVELNEDASTVRLPILWRTERLFGIIANVLRARVTANYGAITVQLEGAQEQITGAQDYFRGLGVLRNGTAGTSELASARPEDRVPQPNAIYVRLSTVTKPQAHTPVLHRIGRDFNVVVTIDRAAFDAEHGGSVEITISGVLAEVQRAIAYLHTTGVHVEPRQRSVTDLGNL